MREYVFKKMNLKSVATKFWGFLFFLSIRCLGTRMLIYRVVYHALGEWGPDIVEDLSNNYSALASKVQCPICVSS